SRPLRRRQQFVRSFEPRDTADVYDQDLSIAYIPGGSPSGPARFALKHRRGWNASRQHHVPPRVELRGRFSLQFCGHGHELGALIKDEVELPEGAPDDPPRSGLMFDPNVASGGPSGGKETQVASEAPGKRARPQQIKGEDRTEG